VRGGVTRRSGASLGGVGCRRDASRHGQRSCRGAPEHLPWAHVGELLLPVAALPGDGGVIDGRYCRGRGQGRRGCGRVVLLHGLRGVACRLIVLHRICSLGGICSRCFLVLALVHWDGRRRLRCFNRHSMGLQRWACLAAFLHCAGHYGELVRVGFGEFF
jgi:hypothetical protein